MNYELLFNRDYKNPQLAKFYLKRYITFINYCKSHLPVLGEYSERHHIVPKSFGGSDNKENIIRLSARQHFIAHWILSRTEDSSMVWAFWLFVNGYNTHLQKRNTKINSRIYEEIKQKFSETVSNSNRNRKMNSKSFRGERNGAYGKHWYKDENGNNYLLKDSDILIEKLNLCRGMHRSEEHNQKISNALKGKKKKYVVYAKGKILINNGLKSIFVEKKDIEKYLLIGYSIGGLPRNRKFLKKD